MVNFGILVTLIRNFPEKHAFSYFGILAINYNGKF